MKWANITSTDIENERGNDKRGKKREQSKLTKDIIRDEKESDDNTTETTRYQPNQTTSPKRTKKNKVGIETITPRDTTRSQSGQKTPCLS